MKRDAETYLRQHDAQSLCPPDCGEATPADEARRRERILESERLGELFLDCVNDSLTELQAGILAYYLAHGRSADAGRYLSELFRSDVERLIRKLEENDNV